MRAPPFLMPGDTVAIVAPAGRVQQDAVTTAVAEMESWGLKIITGKSIYSTHHSYLAGTDEERANDMQQALDNPVIRAIFCARGGYGTTRILDHLDFEKFLRNPKWIVGFSDITALHLQLLNIGVESIHATMPLLFLKPGVMESVQSLRNMLFGEALQIKTGESPFNRPGVVSGEIIGGNLALISDSLGTPSEPDTRGRLLVLEEIEEYKYKLDRMLRQLNRAGKFRHLAGLLVGYMTNIMETGVAYGESVEEIITYNVREYDFPVAFGFPAGHENPNLAWRHGGMASLEVSMEGSVLKQ